jgi:Primase X
LQIYDEERTAKVKQGIRFILSHFEGRQPLFPRKMSTALSQGRQFIVYSEDQILNECEKAGFVDCRLNAYSVSGESQSNELNIFSAQAPNIIFIDIDLSKGYESQEEERITKLNKIIRKTLSIIQKKLDGWKPTVLWTGNGYHIYIVLNTRPLELIIELTELTDTPSEEFLRFAEFIFTNKKKDSCHNPSFKSCLLRIPYTLNSKCIDMTTSNYIKDPEVKIIQEFNSLAIPTINNELLRKFRLYLADKDIITTKLESIKRRNNKFNRYHSYSSANINRTTVPSCYRWIERLLETPIADHRKQTIDLVLVPFLIVIRGLSFEDSYFIIKDWIVKCNSVEMLKPSIEYFDNRIKAAINNSIQNKIPPILQENIEKKYPEWYRQLKEQDILSD